MAVSRDAAAAGALVDASELESTAAATSVRVRNGEALVTDGPYAEVKESLGGYYLFSCDSLEEAIALGGEDPGRLDTAARSRCDPSTSKRRRRHEVRNARLQRPVGLGGALRRGGSAAAGRVDASLDHALRGDGQGRPERASAVSSRPAPRRRSCGSSTAQTIVTDGPFAETKEQLGGVFVTELPDLDEAIRLAALVPAAEYGTLEIRPLVSPVSERLAAVYAEEWPRCVAILTRVLGDLERAEDAVQDAFTTALERWPQTGHPGQPRRLDRDHRPQPRDRPDPA